MHSKTSLNSMNANITEYKSCKKPQNTTIPLALGRIIPKPGQFGFAPNVFLMSYCNILLPPRKILTTKPYHTRTIRCTMRPNTFLIQPWALVVVEVFFTMIITVKRAHGKHPPGHTGIR